MTTRITSRQHPVVRRCRDLAARRDRDSGFVLLDGEHLIADAIAAAVRIDTLLTADESHPLAVEVAARGGTVFTVSPPVLSAASPVRTPSGVLAIAAWTPLQLSDVFDRRVSRYVGLVDVQDPGNAGAVIRCADAFGGVPVLALGSTADPGGWKALRGAMGSTFRIKVARGSTENGLTQARERRVAIAATVTSGGTSVLAIDWSQPTLVLLGSEGAGLENALVAAADYQLAIPMRPHVNSLNVSAAAAVILFQAFSAFGSPRHLEAL